MKVIYLVKDFAPAWGLMPHALERIRAFCAKYGTDMGAEYLCEKLTENFGRGRQCSMMGFLFVTSEGEIVGHCVIAIDDWGPKRYLTILQYEVDRDASPEFTNEALRQVEHWGRTAGATDWQAITRDATLARVFRTFYGFHEEGTLIRKPFAPLTATVGTTEASEGTKIGVESEGVSV
jgi:hypothetical protein